MYKTHGRQRSRLFGRQTLLRLLLGPLRAARLGPGAEAEDEDRAHGGQRGVPASRTAGLRGDEKTTGGMVTSGGSQSSRAG